MISCSWSGVCVIWQFCIHIFSSRSCFYLLQLDFTQVSHFFPVLVKGLYQTEAYMYITCNAVSTHLNHKRIFLFFTRFGCVVAIAHSKYQLQTPLACYIFYLSRIFFFLERQFRSKKTICWILSFKPANSNRHLAQRIFKLRAGNSLWCKRM